MASNRGDRSDAAAIAPDRRDRRPAVVGTGAFASADVGQTYREMVECGVEFASPPQKEHWGTFAAFRDSDGTSLCSQPGSSGP